MSKQSLTFDDFVTCLKMMSDTPIENILKHLDPAVKETDMYYYHQRVQYHAKASDVCISEATVMMMKEEKIDSVVIALAMFGYSNFYMGVEQERRMRARKDDRMSQVLDKLASDLGERVEIVKINFDKNEDKSARPPFGERDRTTDTGEGEGN